MEGFCEHRFKLNDERRRLEGFQSVITTSTVEGHNYGYFPKNVKLQINVVQIMRKQFLQKKLNNTTLLNQRLYRIFLDTEYQKPFAYFGSHNLKLADTISALHDVKQEGMIRILQIEGLLYQVLSLHIQQHDKEIKNKSIETTLLKRELKMIRELAGKYY